MAKGAIINFFEAAAMDRKLHKELTELAERFAALAEEYGYDFTAEELLELGTACPLPDDDVGSTVGGGGLRGYHFPPSPTPRCF